MFPYYDFFSDTYECISSLQTRNINEQMCKPQFDMKKNYDTKPQKKRVSLHA